MGNILGSPCSVTELIKNRYLFCLFFALLFFPSHGGRGDFLSYTLLKLVFKLMAIPLLQPPKCRDYSCEKTTSPSPPSYSKGTRRWVGLM